MNDTTIFSLRIMQITEIRIEASQALGWTLGFQRKGTPASENSGTFRIGDEESHNILNKMYLLVSLNITHNIVNVWKSMPIWYADLSSLIMYDIHQLKVFQKWFNSAVLCCRFLFIIYFYLCANNLSSLSVYFGRLFPKVSASLLVS